VHGVQVWKLGVQSRSFVMCGVMFSYFVRGGEGKEKGGGGGGGEERRGGERGEGGVICGGLTYNTGEGSCWVSVFQSWIQGNDSRAILLQAFQSGKRKRGEGEGEVNNGFPQLF